MPKPLTPTECNDLGVFHFADHMENDEYRFRLMAGPQDSSYGYILTRMPQASGGWQDSHYHEGVKETYIVQEGWIGFADQNPDESLRIQIYRADEIFTTHPGRVHNVYLPGGAVIHTVKHGDCSHPNDKFKKSEFDAMTKILTEEDILRIARPSTQSMDSRTVQRGANLGTRSTE